MTGPGEHGPVGGAGEPDEIVEEVYEAPVRAAELGAPRTFKPWHKPRKHYLRIYQWCALVQKLIAELGYKEGDTVTYLGLPGEDFLDIRTLQGVCVRAKVSLKYLGFDVSAELDGEYEKNLSKHEVANLSFVDPMSVILKDRVQHVAIDRSLAQSHFQRMGPFDVINLDLCDSIAGSAGIGSYFDAIRRVCDLQLKNGRTTPWLLFMATRVIRTQLETATVAQLLECIRRNMDASEAFATAVMESLGLSREQIGAEIDRSRELSHNELVNAFCLGIGKWLLQLAMSAQPRVMVTQHKSYCYRIEIAEPDMLSMAFRFEPVIEPRVDAAGLAPSTPLSGVEGRSEADLGKELVVAVSEIEDVDEMLKRDAALNARMIEKCGDVLPPRYDKAQYVSWAQSMHTFGSASHPDGGRL